MWHRKITQRFASTNKKQILLRQNSGEIWVNSLRFIPSRDENKERNKHRSYQNNPIPIVYKLRAINCQVWSNFPLQWETWPRMCRGKWIISEPLSGKFSPTITLAFASNKRTRMLTICSSTWSNINSLTWCPCLQMPLKSWTWTGQIWTAYSGGDDNLPSSRSHFIPFVVVAKLGSNSLTPRLRGAPGRASGTFHCLTSFLGITKLLGWPEQLRATAPLQSFHPKNLAMAGVNKHQQTSSTFLDHGSHG